MKKFMIFGVTLSFAVISGAVLLRSLQERQLTNPQLTANEQALADDPIDWEEEWNGDHGGGGSDTCYKYYSESPYNGQNGKWITACKTTAGAFIGKCGDLVFAYSYHDDKVCTF